MKEKITVEICTGTHCFVMGGSDLMLLEDYLPEEFRENVIITGCNCLEYCENRSRGRAPFVRIDGEIMENATISRIIRKIESLILQK